MNIIKKRIGIVGGGQLGTMMILEAKRLGFYVVTLDPSADCPSHSISDELIVAPFNDEKAYIELADKVDVITYEFEHIHVEALEKEGKPVYPSIASLKIIKNKLTQNETLHKHNIPLPRFAPVNSVDDILVLGDEPAFGYPLMLKATLGGYDGKGVTFISDKTEVESAYQSLGAGSIGLMIEEFVDFDREISIIATRGIDGERVIYPPAENEHKNSILDVTIAPARIKPSIAQKAIDIADKVMEVFDGVGTFGVEMFVTKDNEVLVNEVAPRPHNSGHFTIEACFANQFENHIRAITGLPLGNTDLIAPAVMLNLIGESNGPAKLLGLEEAYKKDANLHVHFYGKADSKIDRKMGHVTLMGKTIEETLERAMQAKEIVRIVGE
jgi:5-(carboxyamino)imidazole ribonucleotide synthase